MRARSGSAVGLWSRSILTGRIFFSKGLPVSARLARAPGRRRHPRRAAQRCRSPGCCEALQGGLAEGGERGSGASAGHGRVQAGARARRVTCHFTSWLTFTGRHLRRRIRPSLKFDALRFWCGCPSPPLSPCPLFRSSSFAAAGAQRGTAQPESERLAPARGLCRRPSSGAAARVLRLFRRAQALRRAGWARSTWQAPAGSRERLRGRRHRRPPTFVACCAPRSEPSICSLWAGRNRPASR